MSEGNDEEVVITKIVGEYGESFEDISRIRKKESRDCLDSSKPSEQDESMKFDKDDEFFFSRMSSRRNEKSDRKEKNEENRNIYNADDKGIKNIKELFGTEDDDKSRSSIINKISQGKEKISYLELEKIPEERAECKASGLVEKESGLIELKQATPAESTPRSIKSMDMIKETYHGPDPAFNPTYNNAGELISPKRSVFGSPAKSVISSPKKKFILEVEELEYEVSHKTSTYFMDILGRYFDLINSFDNVYKIEIDERYIVEFYKIVSLFKDRFVLEQIGSFFKEKMDINSMPFTILEIINNYPIESILVEDDKKSSEILCNQTSQLNLEPESRAELSKFNSQVNLKSNETVKGKKNKSISKPNQPSINKQVAQSLQMDKNQPQSLIQTQTQLQSQENQEQPTLNKQASKVNFNLLTQTKLAEIYEKLNNDYFNVLTKIVGMFNNRNFINGFKNFFNKFREYIFDNKTFSLRKFEILLYTMDQIHYLDKNPFLKEKLFSIFYSNIKEEEKTDFNTLASKKLKKEQIKAFKENTKKINKQIKEGEMRIKERFADTNPLVDSLLEKMEEMQKRLNTIEEKNVEIVKDQKKIKKKFDSNKNSIDEIYVFLGQSLSSKLDLYRLNDKIDVKPPIDKPILCIEKMLYRLYRYLVLGSGFNIYFVDFDEGDYQHTVKGHKGNVTSLLFVNDDKKSVLISGSEDKTLKVWDAEDHTFNCTNTIFGHTDSVTCIIFIKKSVIASGGQDKYIKVWNYERSDCIYTLYSHLAGISSLFDLGKNYENGESNYIVSSGFDCTVKIFDLVKKRCIETLSEHKGAVNKVVYCKKYNNRTLVSASSDGTLKIWRLGFNNNKSLYTMKAHNGGATTVSYLYRADKYLLISGGMDNTLKIWSVDKGMHFNTYELGYRLGITAFYYYPEYELKFISTTKDNIFSYWFFVYN